MTPETGPLIGQTGRKKEQFLRRWPAPGASARDPLSVGAVAVWGVTNSRTGHGGTPTREDQMSVNVLRTPRVGKAKAGGASALACCPPFATYNARMRHRRVRALQSRLCGVCRAGLERLRLLAADIVCAGRGSAALPQGSM